MGEKNADCFFLAGATCPSLSCATFIPFRQSEALRSLSMHHSTAPAVRAIMGRISTNTATSYLITGEFVVTLAACTSVVAPFFSRVIYTIFRLVFSCTWGRFTPSRLFPHGLDPVSLLPPPLPSTFSPFSRLRLRHRVHGPSHPFLGLHLPRRLRHCLWLGPWSTPPGIPGHLHPVRGPFPAEIVGKIACV